MTLSEALRSAKLAADRDPFCEKTIVRDPEGKKWTVDPWTGLVDSLGRPLQVNHQTIDWDFQLVTGPAVAASIVVQLSLPCTGCSPNSASSRHWRHRSKATKAHRDESKLRAIQALDKLPRPLTGFPAKSIRITTVWDMAKKYDGDGLYRPLDRQNAIGALKAAVDGLVDAGIVATDAQEAIVWGDVTLNRNARKHGGRQGVTITVDVLA